MILQVKITPNASKNSLEAFQGDLLRIRIAAQPDKGKANDELVEFLAETLHISKSRIKILSGHASRLKRLEIDIDEAEFRKYLSIKRLSRLPA